MAEVEATTHAVHEAPTGFWRKYIFSIDHKVIGIQYWLLALFSVGWTSAKIIGTSQVAVFLSPNVT